jgi:hypothetical protein
MWAWDKLFGGAESGNSENPGAEKTGYHNYVIVSHSYKEAVKKFLDTEGAKELFNEYSYSSKYGADPLSQLGSGIEKLYVRLQRTAYAGSHNIWGDLSIDDMVLVLRTDKIFNNLISEVPKENYKKIEVLQCAQRFYKNCIANNKRLWVDIEKSNMGVAHLYIREVESLAEKAMEFQLNPGGKLLPCNEKAITYCKAHKNVPGGSIAEIVDITLLETRTMLPAVG